MTMRAGFKLVLIGVLLIVLMVPILLLRGLVQERQMRGMEVADDIARSSSRAQDISGPLLLIEAEERLRQQREVHTDGRRETVIEELTVKREVLLAPETLEMDNVLTAHERRRGLFGALIYRNRMTLQARFLPPATPPLEGERIGYRVTGARLIIGVGDSRGIQALALTLDGKPLRVEPGSTLAWLAEGVNAPLQESLWQAGRAFSVTMEADLQGTQSLGWTPLAGEARIGVSADWPHPGFYGQRLPVDPKIDDQGFSAQWQLSRLSSQSLQALSRCGSADTGCAAMQGGFGVKLVDPVDRYLKTDRAMKYALLFLVLVFGAVFFLEALRGVDVHPLQYGLTGLALAMFFLLLLSLSEHVGFGAAYLIAATACVALVSTYMQAVLGGTRRGLLFGALLAGLYGLLYGVLQSEDYALLMGTLALFALLATVMLLTRRFDWRRVGRASAPGPGD
jgi:inner membrane protein